MNNRKMRRLCHMLVSWAVCYERSEVVLPQEGSTYTCKYSGIASQNGGHARKPPWRIIKFHKIYTSLGTFCHRKLKGSYMNSMFKDLISYLVPETIEKFRKQVGNLERLAHVQTSNACSNMQDFDYHKIMNSTVNQQGWSLSWCQAMGFNHT